MFEKFYHFTGRPFQLTPDPRFYYNSQTHKKGMAYLAYGLEQGEGFIIITGPIGSGKTTLVRHLLDELDSNSYMAAMIVNTQLSAENLLRSVAAAFGVDTEGFDYMDRKLLLAVIEKFMGGPVGLDNLAAAIGEEKDTIEDVIEPFLIQQGFLQRTPRGRIATDRAYQHFGLTRPE